MKKFAALSYKSKNAAPVVMVVRIGKNFKKTINLGFALKPGEWDQDSQTVKSGVKRRLEYNTTIEAWRVKLSQWVIKMNLDGFTITPGAFKHFLKEDDLKNFNQFYRQTLEADKKLVGSSYRDQRQTLNILDDFGQVLFTDLNSRFVNEFDNYLAGEGYAINTRGKHHKNIKKYINLAIDYKLLEVGLADHPYRTFKIQRQPSGRVALTREDLIKIEALEYSGSMERVRDLFLISCFTGMRFIDTQAINPGNFIDGKLKYTPIKTVSYTAAVVVPIAEFFEGKALVLLNKCKWHPLRTTNQEINRHLKTIMLDADINKLLTFHVGRHTFLTHIAFETGNIFKVMKYGGIRKTDTAMIYIHLAQDI